MAKETAQPNNVTWSDLCRFYEASCKIEWSSDTDHNFRDGLSLDIARRMGLPNYKNGVLHGSGRPKGGREAS